MSINKEWYSVLEFHESFDHPLKSSPTLMGEERKDKRYKWMLEELNEFLESDTIAGQADAMVDLIYFALGTMVEMGIKPEKLFTIVHEANMSKLWEDGKPRYNEDGKVIKPKAWVDPEEKLVEEINKQKDDAHE